MCWVRHVLNLKELTHRKKDLLLGVLFQPASALSEFPFIEKTIFLLKNSLIFKKEFFTAIDECADDDNDDRRQNVRGQVLLRI